MINVGAAVGTEAFIEKDGQYTRLVGWERISGGDIRNNSDTYTPCTSGVAVHYALDREYSNLTITSAEDLSGEAYGDSVVTTLTDAALDREKFNLVKMTPVGDGQYKVKIYSVLSLSAADSESSAKGRIDGTFEFAVSDLKLATGTIADGQPTIQERTK